MSMARPASESLSCVERAPEAVLGLGDKVVHDADDVLRLVRRLVLELVELLLQQACGLVGAAAEAGFKLCAVDVDRHFDPGEAGGDRGG